MSHPQQMSALILSFVPYVFTFKAVTSTSSIITTENHKQEMRRYPYDHVLFHPGQSCRTCKFLKPARSKHCGICNVCVAKHDHHCIWVMNCLGRGNYIFFIGLMASLGLLLSYGAYLAYVLMTAAMQSDISRLLDTTGNGASRNTRKTWSEFSDSWLQAFAQNVRVGGVGMLAAFTAPLAWGLFFYHLYLICKYKSINPQSMPCRASSVISRIPLPSELVSISKPLKNKEVLTQNSSRGRHDNKRDF